MRISNLMWLGKSLIEGLFTIQLRRNVCFVSVSLIISFSTTQCLIVVPSYVTLVVIVFQNFSANRNSDMDLNPTSDIHPHSFVGVATAIFFTNSKLKNFQSQIMKLFTMNIFSFTYFNVIFNCFDFSQTCYLWRLSEFWYFVYETTSKIASSTSYDLLVELKFFHEFSPPSHWTELLKILRPDRQKPWKDIIFSFLFFFLLRRMFCSICAFPLKLIISVCLFTFLKLKCLKMH